MKKKYYIFLVIIVTILFLTLIINKCIKKDSETKNNIENEISIDFQEENSISNENNILEENTIVEVTSAELENMKNNINATGNTEIYQVEEEKGGRKILQIKPQVQFYVDLAGIIKKSKPKEQDLEKLVEKAPTDNGIWISSQSRQKFLELLNKNKINNFTITDTGYLKNNGNIQNDIGKQLEKMINSNKLYIINITGIAYQIDYISGEIVEYPFEEMDPEQILETYQDENNIILEITTNKKQKLTDEEILETIVKY